MKHLFVVNRTVRLTLPRHAKNVQAADIKLPDIKRRPVFRSMKGLVWGLKQTGMEMTPDGTLNVYKKTALGYPDFFQRPMHLRDMDKAVRQQEAIIGGTQKEFRRYEDGLDALAKFRNSMKAIERSDSGNAVEKAKEDFEVAFDLVNQPRARLDTKKQIMKAYSDIGTDFEAGKYRDADRRIDGIYGMMHSLLESWKNVIEAMFLRQQVVRTVHLFLTKGVTGETVTPESIANAQKAAKTSFYNKIAEALTYY